MRTFYIFNVNKEMTILSKESPYLLFKSLEAIYNAKKSDYVMASNLYEQIALKINKTYINDKIKSFYESSEFYLKSANYHSYYNKYKDEKITIEIKNSYIKVNCNKDNLSMFKGINENLFACDFTNKDYFWLDEVYC